MAGGSNGGGGGGKGLISGWFMTGSGSFPRFLRLGQVHGVDDPLHRFQVVKERLASRLRELVEGVGPLPDKALGAGDVADRLQLLQVNADRSVGHVQPVLQRRKIQSPLRL